MRAMSEVGVFENYGTRIRMLGKRGISGDSGEGEGEEGRDDDEGEGEGEVEGGM